MKVCYILHVPAIMTTAVLGLTKGSVALKLKEMTALHMIQVLDDHALLYSFKLFIDLIT